MEHTNTARHAKKTSNNQSMGRQENALLGMRETVIGAVNSSIPNIIRLNSQHKLKKLSQLTFHFSYTQQK